MNVEQLPILEGHVIVSWMTLSLAKLKGIYISPIFFVVLIFSLQVQCSFSLLCVHPSWGNEKNRRSWCWAAPNKDKKAHHWVICKVDCPKKVCELISVRGGRIRDWSVATEKSWQQEAQCTDGSIACKGVDNLPTQPNPWTLLGRGEIPPRLTKWPRKGSC